MGEVVVGMSFLFKNGLVLVTVCMEGELVFIVTVGRGEGITELVGDIIFPMTDGEEVTLPAKGDARCIGDESFL